MRVNIHNKEVQNALDILNIPYKLFTPAESEGIYTNFCEKYAQKGVYEYPLWDHFDFDTTFSVQNENAWLWFENLPQDQKIWLFFEKEEDQQVFEIENGHLLSQILGECYLFTFYVTDPDLNFFFSFNDHEIMMAGGEKAIHWLQEWEKAEQLCKP
jgi:hypothetical protein